MEYTIDNAEIYNLANEEISRIANIAYSEDGASLYDSVVLHSNDLREVKRLQGDAVNIIIKRLYMIVTVRPSDSEGNPRLSFNVPDLDTSTEGAIREELTRFIVLNICAAWFQSRAKDKVEEFAARSQAALEKSISMLYTRQTPQRA